VKALQDASEGTTLDRPPIEKHPVKPWTKTSVGDPVKTYKDGGYVEGE